MADRSDHVSAAKRASKPADESRAAGIVPTSPSPEPGVQPIRCVRLMKSVRLASILRYFRKLSSDGSARQRSRAATQAAFRALMSVISGFVKSSDISFLPEVAISPKAASMAMLSGSSQLVRKALPTGPCALLPHHASRLNSWRWQTQVEEDHAIFVADRSSRTRASGRSSRSCLGRASSVYPTRIGRARTDEAGLYHRRPHRCRGG